jgi:hypothetical protein
MVLKAWIVSQLQDHTESVLSGFLSAPQCITTTLQTGRSRVRYRKVAGSISVEVIFLNLPNPSGSTRLCGLLSL